MIGAPAAQVRIEAEGHDAGGIGSGGRQLLYGDLGLGSLEQASVRHQDRGTAYRAVEHLHQALLGCHVRLPHQGKHAGTQVLPFRTAQERIHIRHRLHRGLCEMRRAGAVYESAAEVCDLRAVVEHAHAAGVRNIGHITYLYIVREREAFELRSVFSSHDYGHALLRLADRQLGGVQAVVLHGHAVQVDVQAVSKLADCYAHAASAEVVGTLDEARNLGAAEEALELALLGGIALLHLAAGGLEGRAGMALGRSGRTADAVAAGASAQQKHHVAGDGLLAAHVRCLYGSYHGTDLKALCGVAGVVDFAHVCGCEADLVAVAGIAGRGLAGDYALGQLAGDGIRHACADVAGAGDTHCLVDVGAAGKRVADCAAEAGGCATERFYLGRMVVCLVLELQQPLLRAGGGIDVHEDAAGVVLAAHLEVVQETLRTQVTGAHGRHFHEAEALLAAAYLPAGVLEQFYGCVDVRLDEGLVHGVRKEFRVEGGVSAVVAPVGVKDAQLRLGGVAALAAEPAHHLAEVVGVHRQSVCLAEGFQGCFVHFREAFEDLHGLDVRAPGCLEAGDVLLAALHGVDEIVAYGRKGGVGNVVVEYQQARGAYLHVGVRVQQVDAVHG